MAQPSMLSAGTVDELKTKGYKVVHGPDRPIVVFYNDGDICAVDNRCPHMGFPLHRGECKDGIITCHWHHAQFDATSGCAFDLFAGDAEPFDIEIRSDQVFVSSFPRPRDLKAHSLRRLQEGLETNNPLVLAKSLLQLSSLGVPEAETIKNAGLVGATHRDNWGAGLTSITATSNVLKYLSPETAYLVLLKGLRVLAGEISGSPPRRERYVLETSTTPESRLSEWFDQWIERRHRDGAERTLLTSLAAGADEAEVSRMLFTGATVRYYAEIGHVADFTNKAFELLDTIGWEHANTVLPTVLAQMAAARGGEEGSLWRTPDDLISMVEPLQDELPALSESASGKHWADETKLIHGLLSEDPSCVVGAFKEAVMSGASVEQIAQCVAYAAAERVAAFAPSNEIGDWFTIVHTFSYCSALHHAAKRCPDTALLRGLLHGAVTVYLDRFLNVPKNRMPRNLDDLPTQIEEIRTSFLASLDTKSGEDLPARLVARYLDLDLPLANLVDMLAFAVAREDSDFHMTQMLEGAVKEYNSWGPSEHGRTIMVAAARYISALSPTQRNQYQTARTALRLHRGEKIYEEQAD